MIRPSLKSEIGGEQAHTGLADPLDRCRSPTMRTDEYMLANDTKTGDAERDPMACSS
jgi:hypothetical protein